MISKAFILILLSYRTCHSRHLVTAPRPTHRYWRACHRAPRTARRPEALESRIRVPKWFSTGCTARVYHAVIAYMTRTKFRYGWALKLIRSAGHQCRLSVLFHVPTYIYVCVYIYTHMYVAMYLTSCLSNQQFLYSAMIYMYIYIYAHTYICIHMCVYVHIYIYVTMYLYVYVYTLFKERDMYTYYTRIRILK